ncbi:uncharacterized protein RHOBADRAFT_53094 [Rhodotorula graminis WP1]|uniref:Uncharacterized protein n=1 Tax=Rhodotorula graminis (strain WP1) TaxID=578459 RepID=A0A194S691_RHOGW|nr:uncharacterized protein RHOBADRAFT_53094 [Rhodotorula graminis WP1]KPV76107.1 hypothetical protein RHOBADRAFT_53094 [Rhodotorula graminis WP1]
MAPPGSAAQNEAHSSPSSAAVRLCRRLAVDARAHDQGVTARLYCKVVVPTSASYSPVHHHLLALDPLSTLAQSFTYALPLHPADPPAAHAAARNLGLQSAVPPRQGDDDEALRRVRRRSSAASDLLERLSSPTSDGAERRSAEVSVREGEVVLSIVSAAQDGLRAKAQSSAPRPTSPHASATASAEFLVVLELEMAFGALRLPRFANSVTIPTPLCLRSELAFTLPSPTPSSASSAWDLSIRPSLSNADSTDLDGGATQVTGSFPSSPSLSLRWAPQLAAGEDVPLVIPRASLETAWTVDERGGATAEVRVSGEFELAGLREKPWVELEFATHELPEVRLSWDDEGDTPVLAYAQTSMLAQPQASARPISSRASTATTVSTASPAPVPPARSPFIPPLPRELDDFASPVLDDSLQLLASSSVTSSVATTPSFPFTPTPTSRRRPLNPRATEARPPSFTSLFDTAPPAPPVLDTSFAEMQSSPGKDERRRDLAAVGVGAAGGPRGGLSLMRTPAPFDPEASAMDMSFEVSALEDGASAEGGDEVESSGATEHSSPVPPLLPETPTGDVPVAIIGAHLRIQLDVSEALRRFAAASTLPDPPAAPTFACRFFLVYSPESTISKNGRVALSPIHIPAAQSEDALIVVSSASPTLRVEVIPSVFSAAASVDVDASNAPPSPLPALGRSARWATSRWAGAPPGPAVEVELRAVEVEREQAPPPPPLLIEEEAPVALEEDEERRAREDEEKAVEEGRDEVEEDQERDQIKVAEEEQEQEEQEEASSTLAVKEAQQDEPAPDADEPAPLDVSTRTEQPATPSLPTPAPSSPPLPASPSPPLARTPTRSLSHVRVEVTPFPPSTSSAAGAATWRLLYRYVLVQPYTGELRVPRRPIRPLEGWGASGATVEPVEKEGALTVEGLREAVVEVDVPVAWVAKREVVKLDLLGFESSVAKLVVVVSVPHGYELGDGPSGFGRGGAGAEVTFTRASPSPTAAVQLDLAFQPLAPKEATIVERPAPPSAPRRDASPAWSARSLLAQFAAVLAALLLFHALSPSVLPPPASAMLSAVAPTRVTPSPPPVLSTVTSLLRTPVTHTVTATTTVERTSTSTAYVMSTQTERMTSTSATTTTRTVTLVLSPSPSSSPSASLVPRHTNVVDDPLLAPTVALAAPTPALTAAPYALAQETAADLVAAVRLWVERGKLRARSWWSVVVEYLRL